MSLQVGVLGPLEVTVDDAPVAIAAAKERLLLATLIANANAVVSVDRLIDELWSDAPPASANKTLQTYVSHLRRHLGDRLGTDAGGYVLDVGDDAGSLDAARFEQLVREGRLALLRGDGRTASGRLGEALALWRGEAYAGIDGSRVRAEATRLRELQTAALEDWFEARLIAGQYRELSAELEVAVAEHPLRERLWALLMRALYASGRQADSLRVFQRARDVLVAELGVEPGAELRAVEAAVLNHQLDVPVGVSATAEPKYVTADDGIRVAYSTSGSGERTVVFLSDIFVNIELLSEIPELGTFLDSAARDARLILIQPRGTGISDRETERVLAPPQVSAGDVDLVLAATGADDVALVGWGHGGQLALAYAATRPERVTAAAVVNSYARLSEAADYPVGLSDDFLDMFLAYVEQVWGTYRPPVPIFAPEVASDPLLINRVSRAERLTASPREAVQLHRALNAADVRAFVPKVVCPVLVLFLTESVTSAAVARWLADALPIATYVEMPGHYVPTGDEAVAAGEAVARFLRDPSG